MIPYLILILEFLPQIVFCHFALAPRAFYNHFNLFLYFLCLSQPNKNHVLSLPILTEVSGLVFSTFLHYTAHDASVMDPCEEGRVWTQIQDSGDRNKFISWVLLTAGQELKKIKTRTKGQQANKQAHSIKHEGDSDIIQVISEVGNTKEQSWTQSN